MRECNGRKKMMDLIESFHYWDARSLSLSSNYFSDEVSLVFDNDDKNDVLMRFLQCYKVEFNQCLGFIKDKPIKELSKPQIPYFLQDIKVEIIKREGIELYKIRINMAPLDLEIWCKDISIKSVTRSE
jgi:hypothetical protein